MQCTRQSFDAGFGIQIGRQGTNGIGQQTGGCLSQLLIGQGDGMASHGTLTVWGLQCIDEKGWIAHNGIIAALLMSVLGKMLHGVVLYLYSVRKRRCRNVLTSLLYSISIQVYCRH